MHNKKLNSLPNYNRKIETFGDGKGGIKLNHQSARLFVGDIKMAEKSDLESAFAPFGLIREIWMAHNPPGFAFIEYFDPTNALDALKKLNGACVKGDKLRVEFSKNRNNNYYGFSNNNFRSLRDQRGVNLKFNRNSGQKDFDSNQYNNLNVQKFSNFTNDCFSPLMDKDYEYKAGNMFHKFPQPQNYSYSTIDYSSRDFGEGALNVTGNLHFPTHKFPTPPIDSIMPPPSPRYYCGETRSTFSLGGRFQPARYNDAHSQHGNMNHYASVAPRLYPNPVGGAPFSAAIPGCTFLPGHSPPLALSAINCHKFDYINGGGAFRPLSSQINCSTYSSMMGGHTVNNFPQTTALSFSTDVETSVAIAPILTTYNSKYEDKNGIYQARSGFTCNGIKPDGKNVSSDYKMFVAESAERSRHRRAAEAEAFGYCIEPFRPTRGIPFATGPFPTTSLPYSIDMTVLADYDKFRIDAYNKEHGVNYQKNCPQYFSDNFSFDQKECKITVSSPFDQNFVLFNTGHPTRYARSGNYYASSTLEAGMQRCQPYAKEFQKHNYEKTFVLPISAIKNGSHKTTGLDSGKAYYPHPCSPTDYYGDSTLTVGVSGYDNTLLTNRHTSFEKSFSFSPIRLNGGERDHGEYRREIEETGNYFANEYIKCPRDKKYICSGDHYVINRRYPSRYRDYCDRKVTSDDHRWCPQKGTFNKRNHNNCEEKVSLNPKYIFINGCVNESGSLPRNGGVKNFGRFNHSDCGNQNFPYSGSRRRGDYSFTVFNGNTKKLPPENNSLLELNKADVNFTKNSFGNKTLPLRVNWVNNVQKAYKDGLSSCEREFQKLNLIKNKDVTIPSVTAINMAKLSSGFGTNEKNSERLLDTVPTSSSARILSK